MRWLVLLCLGATAAQAGSPATYECRIDQICIAGETCQTAMDSFILTPTPEGYGASIDGDQVKLRRIAPPSAEMQTFAIASPDSIAVMLSLLPDGAVIVTIQEELDGPHAETMIGQCVQET